MYTIYVCKRFSLSSLSLFLSLSLSLSLARSPKRGAVRQNSTSTEGTLKGHPRAICQPYPSPVHAPSERLPEIPVAYKSDAALGAREEPGGKGIDARVQDTFAFAPVVLQSLSHHLRRDKDILGTLGYIRDIRIC